MRRAHPLAFLLLVGTAGCGGPTYDVVLQGGTVEDGTGAPARVADVAIVGGRIAKVGDASGDRATRRIDARGLVVAPGFIDTEMTGELPEEVKAAILGRIPQGRMGSADEVADVVAFLATRGGYVNGTVLHVNGGMYGG